MKKEMGTRRAHMSTVGPSLLLKTVKQEDSFARFAAIHDTNWQWEEQLREFRTDTLFREDDPFGAQEFYVPYSLNKRRRWIVPDIVGDEIEDVQDASRSLRVSATVHSLSRNDILPIWQPSPWGTKHGITMVERLLTEEYHDVHPDGRSRHRVRKHAQLITLDRDEKKKGTIHDDIAARSSLPYEKDQIFQKAHVRYNVIRMVRDSRKVHRYNKPRYNHWGTYGTTIRDKERQRNDHDALLDQELRELPWCTRSSCSYFECNCSRSRWDPKEDDIGDNVLDSTSQPPPPTSTLVDCVVTHNKQRDKGRKRIRKAKFIDDSIRIRTSFAAPTTSTSSEDDADDAYEIVEEHSPLRLSINDKTAFEMDEGDCPICVDSYGERGGAFSLACGRRFCVQCWLGHAQVCLDKEDADIGCMDSQCSEVLLTGAARLLLSSDSFAHYQAVVRESRVRKGTARRCPQCRWPVDYSGDHRGESCSCGALLCSHCPALFHSPLPCDRAAAYNAYLRKNGMDQILGDFPSAAVVTELARCPNCAAYMQRSVGCDHMQCVCGASFCFRCGGVRNERHLEGRCKQQTLETTILMDVFTRSGASIFPRKILEQALGRRAHSAMRKAEIVTEMSVLPRSQARMYMRKVAAICTLLESALLCSKMSAVARIDMALCRFLNAKRVNGANKREEMARRANEMIADCFAHVV